MNYLDNLNRPDPNLRGHTEATVPPPRMPGEAAIAPSVFDGMRRSQLWDVLRAYDMFTPALESLPLTELRVRVQYYLDDGKFRGPPLRPYYFERAKFSPDEMKFARLPESNGYCVRKDGTGRSTTMYCGHLLGYTPWTGPDPDAPLARRGDAAKPVKAKAPTPTGSPSMPELRARAKALGVSTFGASRRALLSAIVAAEGQAAANSPEPPEAA